MMLRRILLALSFWLFCLAQRIKPRHRKTFGMVATGSMQVTIN
jgi:hypothetical protein